MRLALLGEMQERQMDVENAHMGAAVATQAQRIEAQVSPA